MGASENRSDGKDGLELVITRVFDAPRRLVWKAWTDPAMLVRWMGPRDYPAVAYENDLRPGGRWRGALRTPEGGRLGQGGVYREVVDNERLVFTFVWDPPHGDSGHEMLVSVSFADEGSKTRMVFRQTALPSEAERRGHQGGWTSSFDRLDELLPTLR